MIKTVNIGSLAIISITFNNKKHQIKPDSNINSFLESLGILDGTNSQIEGKALALNQKIVPANKWADTSLTEGAELLLIEAAQGG